MDGKKLLDLSSFILFEATGDSEADANINQVYIDIGEDDAMSCSYDFSDNGSINDQYDDDNDHGFELIEDGNICYVEYGSDDEDEGVVNQAWRGDKMAAEQKPQKSNACVVDSSMKLINNQREQDRLFWEACLAS